MGNLKARECGGVGGCFFVALFFLSYMRPKHIPQFCLLQVVE